MSKINLCIATTGTFPQGMASTYRIHCYAKALQQEGVPVEVVSTLPVQQYSGKRWGYRSVYEGIPFSIVWNTGRSKHKWVNYLRAEISSYLLLWHCILKVRQYNVLWLYGMGFIPRLILLPLLHLAGKKVILELNEYPYSTEGNKYTKISALRKLLQGGTLHWVFPQLDGVVVISEKLKKVVERYGKKAKVLKVPILLDSAKYQGLGGETNKPLNHPYLFHAGSLSEQKDGVLAMVKAFMLAAKQLKEEGIQLHWVITNKTSHLWDNIETLLQEAGLIGQLIVTGYLQDKELQHWLRHAAVLLINKPPSFQNQYNFPTKLGDYMLSGRPVIVAAQGMELNQYLKDGVNSFSIPPNDEKAMAGKIVELLKEPKLAESIGQKGRQTGRQTFDYRIHAKRIAAFVSQ